MLSPRCWDRLAGVNPRLAAVAALAHSNGPRDFIITEGLRTKERQAELFRAGKSLTMNSKHLVGKAIDIAVLEYDLPIWDLAAYREVWEWQFRPAAARLGVNIEWGGNWSKLRDGPHFELV